MVRTSSSSSRESGGAKPRLLIADHGPTRLAIRLAVDGAASICAEAASANDAVEAAAHHQPDVCLVGREIPGDGIAAARRISDVAPQAAVIILTASPEAGDLMAALRSGAIGYLPATTGPDALRRVIKSAMAGEAALTRGMVRELIRELLAMTSPPGGRLSTREAQVLGLLRRGYSTSVMADRLGISPVTVRRHISRAMRKTGHDNRLALMQGSPATRRAVPQAAILGQAIGRYPMRGPRT